MPTRNSITINLKLISLALLLVSTQSAADDVEDLTANLQQFLAGVTLAATHDEFWAEDLIYTSSRGTRTSKAEIMSGFGSDNAEDAADSGPAYTAEEIQIQIYDDAAVVAFRLIASPTDSLEKQEYLNTGTFVKRDDRWQAVAWQATVIPGTIIPAE